MERKIMKRYRPDYHTCAPCSALSLSVGGPAFACVLSQAARERRRGRLALWLLEESHAERKENKFGHSERGGLGFGR